MSEQSLQTTAPKRSAADVAAEIGPIPDLENSDSDTRVGFIKKCQQYILSNEPVPSDYLQAAIQALRLERCKASTARKRSGAAAPTPSLTLDDL